MSIFKLFEKKKKEVEEQRILIDELDSWMVDRINDELRGVYAQGDEIRKHIQGLILSIKQTIEEIVGAESKKSALSTAIDKVADLASMEVLAFENIVELRDGLAQDMTRLGEVWNAYKRNTQKDMRSYTTRLHVWWKQIDGEINRLSTLINTHSSRVAALKRCQEQANLLMTKVKEMREMAEKLNALGNNLQSLEATRANFEIQIERIKSTREFETSVKLKGDLSTLENRRVEITSIVRNGFSSLRRPLDKYGYAGELSKEKRRLLDSYISETPRALSATNDSPIQEILSDLRKYILQGRIEIKNPQKTVLNIEEMSTELPKLGQEYRMLTGRIETLESQVNKTAEENFRGLETKLGEAREAIRRAKLESKDIREEEQPRLHSEINTMVSAVERSVYENFGIPLLLSRDGNLEPSRGTNPGRVLWPASASSSTSVQSKPIAPSHQSSTSPQEPITEPITALKEKLARGKINEAQFEKLARQRYDYLKNKQFSELSDSELEERINGFEGLDIYPKY